MVESKRLHPIVERNGYSLSQAQNRTLRLEALLSKHNIKLPSTSALEAIALSVFEVLYEREDAPADDFSDVRNKWKHLIGMNELAGLILSVENHPEFDRLVPALQLLTQGVAIQNMPSPARDQATNKVFELFAGIFALHSGGRDIEIDDNSAQGRNPDVLVTIDGRRWGIACKSLHGDNPQGFITHLKKAIDQIEKSPAEVGVALFTIKNLLDQSKYWSIANPDEVKTGALPMFTAFTDPNRPFEMLVQDASAVGKALFSYLPAGYLQQAFKGKKCLPGFLVWASVVTAVAFDDIPVPTSARIMAWQHAAPIAPNEYAVLQRLHDAAYAADRD